MKIDTQGVKRLELQPNTYINKILAIQCAQWLEKGATIDLRMFFPDDETFLSKRIVSHEKMYYPYGDADCGLYLIESMSITDGDTELYPVRTVRLYHVVDAIKDVASNRIYYLR